MSKQMGIDAFLGHKTSKGGGGGNFLGRWKDRKPPQVDVWLHTGSKICSVWRHTMPCIRVDFKTKEQKLSIMTAVCWEAEDDLTMQYRRDRDTGVRKNPVTACPIDFMIEWLRTEVTAGRLDMLAPVFKYKVGGSSIIVRAGHVYGGFGAEDLDEKIKERMKKLKVFQTETWKLNHYPKAYYIMAVADNDDLPKGIQITTEPALLGDKLKGLIKDTMESVGHEEGNPLEHPYCMRLKHMPEEAEFGKRFRVVRLEKVKLTPAVKKLIVKTPPPDISRHLEPFDHKEVLATLQEHCVLETMPWKDIYAFAKKGLKVVAARKAEEDAEDREDDEEEEVEKPTKKLKKKVVVDDEDGGTMKVKKLKKKVKAAPAKEEEKAEPVAKKLKKKVKAAKKAEAEPEGDDIPF